MSPKSLEMEIKEARIRKNLSQKDLADKIKAHSQFVSNFERQVCTVPPKHFKVISKTLGIPLKKMIDLKFDYEKSILLKELSKKVR